MCGVFEQSTTCLIASGHMPLSRTIHGSNITLTLSADTMLPFRIQ